MAAHDAPRARQALVACLAVMPGAIGGRLFTSIAPQTSRQRGSLHRVAISQASATPACRSGTDAATAARGGSSTPLTRRQQHTASTQTSRGHKNGWGNGFSCLMAIRVQQPLRHVLGASKRLAPTYVLGVSKRFGPTNVWSIVFGAAMREAKNAHAHQWRRKEPVSACNHNLNFCQVTLFARAVAAARLAARATISSRARAPPQPRATAMPRTNSCCRCIWQMC
jgi:hypothetical protein